MVETVPHGKSNDGYAVTSEVEIESMRSYLGRASAVKHLDQETRQEIQRVEAYLQKMEGHTFNTSLSAWRFDDSLWMSHDGSVGATFASWR
jgi:hypothetical protein